MYVCMMVNVRSSQYNCELSQDIQMMSWTLIHQFCLILLGWFIVHNTLQTSLYNQYKQHWAQISYFPGLHFFACLKCILAPDAESIVQMWGKTCRGEVYSNAAAKFGVIRVENPSSLQILICSCAQLLYVIYCMRSSSFGLLKSLCTDLKTAVQVSLWRCFKTH